jgi:hypothetical protein
MTALRRADPNAKLLLFAGFPGLAAELVVFLQNTLGSGQVVQFTYNLPSHNKEDAARNLRWISRFGCWYRMKAAGKDAIFNSPAH